jgi:hypothetical protein
LKDFVNEDLDGYITDGFPDFLLRKHQFLRFNLKKSSKSLISPFWRVRISIFRDKYCDLKGIVLAISTSISSAMSGIVVVIGTRIPKFQMRFHPWNSGNSPSRLQMRKRKSKQSIRGLQTYRRRLGTDSPMKLKAIPKSMLWT